MTHTGNLDSRSHWLLSSSGARPLYLENIVRALALPSGEPLQFRYEESIVSLTFRERLSNNNVTGDVAYLTYLDNRQKTEVPKLYPVREAQIVEASKRGSSYIIHLNLTRFVNYEKVPDLSDLLRRNPDNHHDMLPNWSADHGTPIGFWVAQTKPFDDQWLVAYESEHSAHLLAFESTVRRLTASEDFRGGKVLFANILGVRKIPQNHLITNRQLAAGHVYKLSVYHYLNAHDPHYKWTPFWIELSSESPYVAYLSKSLWTIEAEYDEVEFCFELKKEAPAMQLSLALTTYGGDREATRVPIMNARLRFDVKSDWLEPAVRIVFMTVGIAGAQIVALVVANKFNVWACLVVILFSFVAAAASVLRRKFRP